MTHLSGKQIVATISSLKNIFGEMETILNMPENQNFQVSDIINKLLTNSAELSEKIKTGEFKELPLASLKTSERLVIPLIPNASLRTHSRKLIEEINQSISIVNQGSTSTSGNNSDEIVLLVSTLLLLLNIQN